MNKKDLYAKFYPQYNRIRDKLILWYLKRLKKNPKKRARYERLATAYWNTRLANRPFIIPKPEYVNRETPESRKAWRDFYSKRGLDK